MPAAVPLIGAAAGLAGSAISASAQKKAAKTAANAAAFKPYSTSNMFGSTQWDTTGKNVTQTLSPFAQQIADSLQSRAVSGLDPTSGAQGMDLRSLGLGDLMGAYGDANSYGGLSPDFANQVMGGYAGLFGQGAPMLGDPAQVGARRAYGPNSGSVDVRGLMSGAAMNPFAQQQMGMGAGLLNSNYGDVANQQLDLMRQQAAPYEQQQTNGLFQKLQSMGRLNSTPGGRDIAAFSEGLGRADTARQLGAMDFAQGLRSSDQQLGANLFNTGAGNYLQGLGLAGNLAGNYNSNNLARDQYSLGANQFNSNLGLQAALANQGVNTQYDMANQNALMAQFGNQLSALQGYQNFGVNADQLGYSRANDRVSRANDLFGFGTALSNEGTNNAANYLNLLSGLTGQQQDMVNTGIQAGGAQADAGANAGRFTMSAAGSPVGGFFQGLGGSILQNGVNNGAFNFGSSGGNLDPYTITGAAANGGYTYP